jgi:hypothetical protein
MSGPVVRGLKARAVVAKPASEIRRARRQARRGDRAWQQRLGRYEHGDVVIAQLTAIAVIEGAGEHPQTVPCCHETVWIDRETARGAVEERLREIARRDFRTVGDGLRDHRGVQLDADNDAITVEIDIEAALAAHFTPGSPAR